jgi:hypothetical protein
MRLTILQPPSRFLTMVAKKQFNGHQVVLLQWLQNGQYGGRQIILLIWT